MEKEISARSEKVEKERKKEKKRQHQEKRCVSVLEKSYVFPLRCQCKEWCARELEKEVSAVCPVAL